MIGVYLWWRSWRERRADRRAHRLAAKWPDVQPGEWLIDLGMPTDRAVRIKRVYDIQQGRCHCAERCGL